MRTVNWSFSITASARGFPKHPFISYAHIDNVPLTSKQEELAAILSMRGPVAGVIPAAPIKVFFSASLGLSPSDRHPHILHGRVIER
jgi:hypothetical protein